MANSASSSCVRVMLYSHDGLGLGHTRRNINISSALVATDPNVRCLLVSGSDDVFRFTIPERVDVLKLPSLRKVSNQRYEARRNFAKPEEVIALRSSLLNSAARSFSPHFLLADKHPIGVSGELKSGLKSIRRNGGRAFLGLRDILDEPSEVRRSWLRYGLARSLRDMFTGIFVYGQRDICDVSDAYGIDPWGGYGIHYTGYVSEMPTNGGRLQAAGVAEKPLVVVSVGGGEDGAPLIRTAMKAHDDGSHRMIVVGGPQAKEHDLPSGSPGIEYHSFVDDMPSLLGRASVLVCMGGYNTIVEAMQVAIPTVCVPRTNPRTEQLIRAEAFARQGLLRMIHPSGLTALSLREQIRAALAEDRTLLRDRIRNAINFTGAQSTAQLLLEYHYESRVA